MNEKEARRLAELRVKAKQGFKIHLLVYLLINAFSWLNHLLAGTDQSPILYNCILGNRFSNPLVCNVYWQSASKV